MYTYYRIRFYLEIISFIIAILAVLITINIKICFKNGIADDIIASFIFMLEDTRIDRDIREQYLETCKPLKENFFVRIDK